MRSSFSSAWLIGVVLFLWGLQTAWLAWHYAPEIQELAVRVVQGRTGAAVRGEDPFNHWLVDLARVMPPHATYILLDQYEQGKYIDLRYQLYPRRQVRLEVDTPPSFLFYAFRRHRATFLVLRDRTRRLGPGARAVIASPAAQPLDLTGPGLVYRVDWTRFQGFFYD